MTQVILFNVLNGLIVGAFYALMALGLSLILNLSGVINFSHGGFLALGAYIAYSLIPHVGFWGALAIASTQLDPPAELIRTARVWDLTTGKPISPVLHHPIPFEYGLFSPDGRRVYLGLLDSGSLAVLELEGADCSLPGAGLVMHFTGDGTLEDASDLG